MPNIMSIGACLKNHLVNVGACVQV